MAHTDKLKNLMVIITDTFGRIYRPGGSLQDSLQYLINWVGDKNALIGATVISLLLCLVSFSLFAFFFACVFSVFTTAIVFIIAKLVFYKPIEYSIELEDENTILSFVKDIHINGESEVVVHSQPGYGKNKNTYVVLQLSNSVSILDCRNITSVTDKSYRDIEIKFYHPAENDYSIDASSNEGEVTFEVLQQNDEQCRVKFFTPIRNNVRLNFVPSLKPTT
ncbi:MAG: hypothetical protein HND53_00545 [Proteobacteria bacterium]|nr:hypothetical protein [Pseudomonadota bacterium]NOG58963.1 hypothetical protein [Pseudomonadota bacterium]